MDPATTTILSVAAGEVMGRPRMVAVRPAFVKRVLREVDEMAELSLSSLMFDAWRDELWTMKLADRVREVRDGEKADTRPVVVRRKVITAEIWTMMQV